MMTFVGPKRLLPLWASSSIKVIKVMLYDYIGIKVNL